MTGNVEQSRNLQQPNLFPITAIPGTSINYGSVVSPTFTLFNQAIGQIFNRSNATVAMTDTLPNPQVSFGDQGALPNGWFIKINNIDSAAAITLTPVAPAKINGTTSKGIPAGYVCTVYTDGVNYFSETTTH